MNLTDEEIKAMAEEAGFWGIGGIWWYESIPRFRKLLELAKPKASKTDRECECGKPHHTICHCDKPVYPLGPCLKCGGLISL